MNRKSSVWCSLVLVVGGLPTAALAQSAPPPPQPIPVPSATSPAVTTPSITTIDGGLGRCSLELTVTTADGKPASSASVKVHIAYGFGGFHKLDLEAGTNVEGKVKFTGLPSSVRRPPLEFYASSSNSKDQMEGTAEYDPATECHAHRDITLAKPNPQP